MTTRTSRRNWFSGDETVRLYIGKLLIPEHILGLHWYNQLRLHRSPLLHSAGGLICTKHLHLRYLPSLTAEFSSNSHLAQSHVYPQRVTSFAAPLGQDLCLLKISGACERKKYKKKMVCMQRCAQIACRPAKRDKCSGNSYFPAAF